MDRYVHTTYIHQVSYKIYPWPEPLVSFLLTFMFRCQGRNSLDKIHTYWCTRILELSEFCNKILHMNIEHDRTWWGWEVKKQVKYGASWGVNTSPGCCLLQKPGRWRVTRRSRSDSTRIRSLVSWLLARPRWCYLSGYSEMGDYNCSVEPSVRAGPPVTFAWL